MRLNPSTLRSPGVSPQKGRAAHGPRHPALSSSPKTTLGLCSSCVCVCMCVPLGLVSVCLLGFVFVSRVASCMGSCALQDPTLVCFDVWLPLFLFVWDFRRRCFFFFSSLSLGRWGNASPSAVCVSPSFSSSWPQTRSATRTSSPTPTSRNCSSTCFFLSVRFLVDDVCEF